MSELGDDYRYTREQKRKRHEAQGWWSNKHRTYESMLKSMESTHKLIEEIDGMTLKTLKKLKIQAVSKGEHAFQLQLPEGKVMLYDGKNGTFLYVSQTKQHI